VRVTTRAGDHELTARWRDELAATGLEVDLRPGRAIVRDPDEEFTVEIHFAWDNKGRRGRSTGVWISGDFPLQYDLGPYWEAVTLKFLSEPVAKRLRAPKRRPLPGRPADRDFYLEVIGLHNRFVLEGNSNPSAATARLMGESAETVRLWVHRGRRYLEQGR
jgi:hypothetical protein